MTIEQWNIVLSAVIAVLMVVYGVWLRYVLEQQLRSKDAALQALEAALTAKDAEISRLQADTAPAITAAYSTMRKHANEATEDSQRFMQQVKELTQARDRLTNRTPADKLIAECRGILLATDIIDFEFKGVFQQSDLETVSANTQKAVTVGIAEAYDKMNAAIEVRIKEAKAILAGAEQSST